MIPFRLNYTRRIDTSCRIRRISSSLFASSLHLIMYRELRFEITRSESFNFQGEIDRSGEVEEVVGIIVRRWIQLHWSLSWFYVMLALCRNLIVEWFYCDCN